jgi:hypothetical protein
VWDRAAGLILLAAETRKRADIAEATSENKNWGIRFETVTMVAVEWLRSLVLTRVEVPQRQRLVRRDLPALPKVI